MDRAPMKPKGTVELYNKARKMHKALYHKEAWDKEKYKKKIGFQLMGLFGKEFFTFKDLDDTQLNQTIDIMKNKVKKHPRLAPKIQDIVL